MRDFRTATSSVAASQERNIGQTLVLKKWSGQLVPSELNSFATSILRKSEHLRRRNSGPPRGDSRTPLREALARSVLLRFCGLELGRVRVRRTNGSSSIDGLE